eukprot:CAMPEP_0117654194 /NCGR_PEP_ID=MMETSP0804-20121206/3614_1 /TAXON_ID=1074897 /ORGANISM="Tetraselmis astigmatica, Strain CCMP880" /LENGTH=425 /DNA_ID=CAMNT_0005460459 /DNA_START=578 /DNA_END=1852 /DNA_ORIENTATION=-
MTANASSFDKGSNPIPDIVLYQHHESVLEQRMAELLDPWGATELYYVKNHRLQRKHKVFLNVYHLMKPATNKWLVCLRLGGAYHSAIELKGEEFAFGGHHEDTKGIYSCKPLFRLRDEEMKNIDELGLTTKKERKVEEEKRLLLLPPLMERRVIGTWAGTDAEWERILRSLHEQHRWVGPSYRLLTRNCNNFAADMYRCLLDNKHFTSVPGMSEQDMAYLFKLPASTQRIFCCCPSIPTALNGPLPPAPYMGDIFKGRGRRAIATARGMHPSAAAAVRRLDLHGVPQAAHTERPFSARGTHGTPQAAAGRFLALSPDSLSSSSSHGHDDGNDGNETITGGASPSEFQHHHTTSEHSQPGNTRVMSSATCSSQEDCPPSAQQAASISGGSGLMSNGILEDFGHTHCASALSLSLREEPPGEPLRPE